MSAPVTIPAAVEAVRDGRLRIPALIESTLDRIHDRNSTLNAYLHVMGESARRRAALLQVRVERGRWPGPLTGVPVAVKDNILVAGHPTTAASRILGDFVPVYSATAVRRLEAAGAIVIGKANLDEFGMGSSNEHSAYGPVRHPEDPTRVPGGSSGGSAAAVAGGLALGALGSDTGGSVRQPAAFCGLVGLKPYYGSVSRYGLIAFASSLDQIGPLARSAEGCRRLYNAIRGHDARDATSRTDGQPVSAAALARPLAGLRLGVARGAALPDDLDPEVAAALRGAGARFQDQGVEIVPVELPDPHDTLAAYVLLANAEASSNLARYDGVRYGFRSPETGDPTALYARTRGVGFGREVKRRILLGTFVLSAGYYDAYYRRALEARARIAGAYRRLLRKVDAILTPTTPTPAFRIGERLADPVWMYRSDLFTVAANLTGFPALTFPVGRSATHLPIGGQLLGPPGGAALLLRLAARFAGERPVGARAPAPPNTPRAGV